MQMLQDVMENLSKKLTLRLPLPKLTENQIKQLKDIFTAHPGEKQMVFTVFDPNEKIKLTMLPKKQKISISKELLDQLKILEVDYKLN